MTDTHKTRILLHHHAVLLAQLTVKLLAVIEGVSKESLDERLSEIDDELSALIDLMQEMP